MSHAWKGRGAVWFNVLRLSTFYSSRKNVLSYECRTLLEVH